MFPLTAATWELFWVEIAPPRNTGGSQEGSKSHLCVWCGSCSFLVGTRGHQHHAGRTSVFFLSGQGMRLNGWTGSQRRRIATVPFIPWNPVEDVTSNHATLTERKMQMLSVHSFSLSLSPRPFIWRYVMIYTHYFPTPLSHLVTPFKEFNLLSIALDIFGTLPDLPARRRYTVPSKTSKVMPERSSSTVGLAWRFWMRS